MAKSTKKSIQQLKEELRFAVSGYVDNYIDGGHLPWASVQVYMDPRLAEAGLVEEYANLDFEENEMLVDVIRGYANPGHCDSGEDVKKRVADYLEKEEVEAEKEWKVEFKNKVGFRGPGKKNCESALNFADLLNKDEKHKALATYKTVTATHATMDRVLFSLDLVWMMDKGMISLDEEIGGDSKTFFPGWKFKHEENFHKFTVGDIFAGTCGIPDGLSFIMACIYQPMKRVYDLACEPGTVYHYLDKTLPRWILCLAILRQLGKEQVEKTESLTPEIDAAILAAYSKQDWLLLIDECQEWRRVHILEPAGFHETMTPAMARREKDLSMSRGFRAYADAKYFADSEGGQMLNAVLEALKKAEPVLKTETTVTREYRFTENLDVNKPHMEIPSIIESSTGSAFRMPMFTITASSVESDYQCQGENGRRVNVILYDNTTDVVKWADAAGLSSVRDCLQFGKLLLHKGQIPNQPRFASAENMSKISEPEACMSLGHLKPGKGVHVATDWLSECWAPHWKGDYNAPGGCGAHIQVSPMRGCVICFNMCVLNGKEGTQTFEFMFDMCALMDRLFFNHVLQKKWVLYNE